nr:N-formylglutamate amidohydrolase [Caulobacter sp. NIBR2454]
MAPFLLSRAGSPPPTPLVFASPHSGRVYPAEMMAASALGPQDIRVSEDAFVDELIAPAPAKGAAVIQATFARAYVDLNREAWELDPAMFEDELPEFARGRSARVAAGLGSIARVVAEGREIYSRKLSFAEAKQRIETAHGPYHDALGHLLAEARAAHGVAVLIDWHSMPSAAVGKGAKPSDIILGDRYGSSCAPELTRLAEKTLTAMGYRVARNAPYAGGWTTEHYGRPHLKTHALQIELSRALYMDEKSLTATDGLKRLRRDVGRLTEALAAADWSNLR